MNQSSADTALSTTHTVYSQTTTYRLKGKGRARNVKHLVTVEIADEITKVLAASVGGVVRETLEYASSADEAKDKAAALAIASGATLGGHKELEAWY